MSASPTYPEFEIPQPQVAAHAGQIADVVIYLYHRLHEINSVPSLMMEGGAGHRVVPQVLELKNGIAPPGRCRRLPAHRRARPATARTGPTIRRHRGADPEGIAAGLRGLPRPVPRVPQLRDALLPYSNLFVDMRYAFESREGGGRSITDLVNLVRFFRRHVEGMPKQVRFHRP